MMYMVLIAATLISIYKKNNKIESYKIAKIRFKNELHAQILKEIVMLCGGDVSRLEDVGFLYSLSF